MRLTPETLEEKGIDLVQYAKDLAEVLSNIDKKINEIADRWEEFEQEEYFDRYTMIKENFDELPEVVNELGKIIIQVAETYVKIDEELQRQFQSN